MSIKFIPSLILSFLGLTFVNATPTTFEKDQGSPLAGEILCQDLTDPSDMPLSLVISKNLMSMDQYLAELSFNNGKDEEHREWILIKEETRNSADPSGHLLIFSTPKGSANPLSLRIDVSQRTDVRVYPAQLRYSLSNKTFARELRCELND